MPHTTTNASRVRRIRGESARARDDDAFAVVVLFSVFVELRGGRGAVRD
jgi:hypothetical protein